MSDAVVINTATDTSSECALTRIGERVLAESKKQGASQAETDISSGEGMSVTVRLGEVETVEHNRDKSLIVTVYFGHKSGSASTSDFKDAAVKDTVRAACSIAKYTAEDEYNGLADAESLATEFPDLDIYHPWDVSMDEAIEIATHCEDAARNVDKRIINSEGGSVSSHTGASVYANSHGFLNFNQGSRHGISCSVIGQDPATKDAMERDYWYESVRSHLDLPAPELIGKRAADRTLSRLGARKGKTQQATVIFDATVAASILGHLTSAIRGGSLYRKASFLLDHKGKQIFPEFVRIHEQPLLKKAMGSSAYDNEGVATQTRDIVHDGVLQDYVLSTYSARKLGLKSTGNSGGVRNLTIDPGDKNLEQLIKDQTKALLVTEMIGFGVNNVTGDYSRGAAGFWIENGEIQYPVNEITIAGNLKDMFMNIAAVGNDVDSRGNTRTGSIVINNMTIAGA